MTEKTAMNAADGAPAGRVTRHRLPDRLFHWINAVVVIVLLTTSFLPIVGIKFDWVTIHWVAGVVLGVLIVVHAVRALVWQDWRAMAIGMRDIVLAAQAVGWNLRRRSSAPDLPGKYPLLQKLFHHVMALAILILIVTGGLMLAKIDTPFWGRDPYFLSTQAWGIVYVLHGLAAMTVLAMVFVHIYFAIRPEKLWITRSMIVGWITRREYELHHDPAAWREDPSHGVDSSSADGAARSGAPGKP